MEVGVAQGVDGGVVDKQGAGAQGCAVVGDALLVGVGVAEAVLVGVGVGTQGGVDGGGVEVGGGGVVEGSWVDGGVWVVTG